MQPFGEDVCRLICGWNKLDSMILTENSLMNKVVVLYVLGPGMKGMIRSERNGWHIIAPDERARGKEDAHVFEKNTEPGELCSNVS